MLTVEYLFLVLRIVTGFQILRNGRRKYFKKTLTELQLLGFQKRRQLDNEDLLSLCWVINQIISLQCMVWY